MARYLLRRLKKLLFPGSTWLRDYEVEAIVAFYQHLSPSDQGKLVRQFSLLDHLQRSSNGRLLQFFDILDPTRKKWMPSTKVGEKLPMEDYQFSSLDKGKRSKGFVIGLCFGGLAEIHFTRTPGDYEGRFLKVNQVDNMLRGQLQDSDNGKYKFEKLMTEIEIEDLEQELYRSMKE